jgi:hypothetical protein
VLNKKNHSMIPKNKGKSMEQPILGDRNQFPTEEIIFSHLGKNRTLWESFFGYIHSNHRNISEEWRFYNDGKSWLMKAARKSKIIFWLSLIKGSFRITFYFTDKAEEAIRNSSISDKLKDQFKNGKRFNKIRGITIAFKTRKDIGYAKELITLKLSIK